jgi:hypothetical protein
LKFEKKKEFEPFLNAKSVEFWGKNQQFSIFDF